MTVLISCGDINVNASSDVKIEELYHPHNSQYNIQLLLLSCADINECAEDGELCRAGFCRNVPGSWECECREGWQLTPDLRDCADTRTGACFDQYRGGGKSRYIDRLCIHKTSCCNTQCMDSKIL